MEIEFDPTKDAQNIRERGLPLALGAVVLANFAGEFEDMRRDYCERRMIAFAHDAGRLLRAIYTLCGTVVRIISVRRANRMEVAIWLGTGR